MKAILNYWDKINYRSFDSEIKHEKKNRRKR